MDSMIIFEKPRSLDRTKAIHRDDLPVVEAVVKIMIAFCEQCRSLGYENMVIKALPPATWDDDDDRDNEDGSGGVSDGANAQWQLAEAVENALLTEGFGTIDWLVSGVSKDSPVGLLVAIPGVTEEDRQRTVDRVAQASLNEIVDHPSPHIDATGAAVQNAYFKLPKPDTGALFKDPDLAAALDKVPTSCVKSLHAYSGVIKDLAAKRVGELAEARFKEDALRGWRVERDLLSVQFFAKPLGCWRRRSLVMDGWSLGKANKGYCCI